MRKSENLQSKTLMENSPNTLFISTLPYSATSADLETFCSEVGPLRSCFVINDKADASKNAGCGFVTFVLADDAAKAISQLKKKKFMDLRFLKIQFARKQEDHLKADVAENQTLTIKVDKSDLPVQSSHRSLLISDLPGGITKKQLYKKVKKYGTVSSIQFSDGDFKAIIDYNSHQDASNAFKHLNDHVFKGAKIKAEMTRKERYRLFLKNLHFQCTEADIRKVAQEFGSVKDISVPSKNENRGKGFAFLEYNAKDECEKAILGLRGKKIRGREISLDWAVSKKDFLVKGICADSAKNEAEIQNPSQDIATADVGSKSNHDQLYEHSDVESEDYDFEQGMEQHMYVTEELANSDHQEESKDTKKKANKFMEDTTLFIRNLSFDVAQEDLEKCFGVFGKLRYARITMDSETGHSRGSGFICFLKEEDAKACFNSYQEFINTSVVDEWKDNQFSKKGGKEIVSSLTPEPAKALVNSPFFLNGRLLNVTWALSRSDATQAAKDGKARRRAEDKRNMYLITEGVIFTDSDAAKDMSPSELSRRQKSYSERKRLLALNPNLFMSKTRLSIRNLNLQVDDKLLQSAAQNAVSSFWQEVGEGNRSSLESDVMEEAAQAKYSPIGKKKVWVKQV
jgi:nucleolar protein 4